MGERANAKGYLMNYHVKAAGETLNRVLPVWVFSLLFDGYEFPPLLLREGVQAQPEL